MDSALSGKVGFLAAGLGVLACFPGFQLAFSSIGLGAPIFVPAIGFGQYIPLLAVSLAVAHKQSRRRLTLLAVVAVLVSIFELAVGTPVLLLDDLILPVCAIAAIVALSLQARMPRHADS
jgi:hypothetical protein